MATDIISLTVRRYAVTLHAMLKLKVMWRVVEIASHKAINFLLAV